MNFPTQIRHLMRGGSGIARVVKSGPATQAVMALSLAAKGQDVVMLVPGEGELNQMRALLTLLSGPAWTPRSSDTSGISGAGGGWIAMPSFAGTGWMSGWPGRMAALAGLRRRGRARVALVSVDNLLPKWPPCEVVDQAEIIVRKGEEILPEMILEQLVAWGYRRVPLVTAPGEMGMRGDILDVFPPGRDTPVRIEFFGDTVDALRGFNPASQRSVGELESCIFLPAAPCLVSDEYLGEAREKWGHLKVSGQISAQAREYFENRAEQGEGLEWPGLYYEKPAHLANYLPGDAVYLLCGADSLRTRLEEARWALEERLEARSSELGFKISASLAMWPEGEGRKTWLDKRQVVFEELVMGERKEALEMAERAIDSFTDLFWKPEAVNRPWSALSGALKEWTSSARQTILSFRSPRARDKFSKLASQEGIELQTEYSLTAKGVFALVSPLSKGMELPEAGVRILPEAVLQPKGDRARARPDRDFKGLTTSEELSPGDLLVHRDFGLCRFQGLERLNIGQNVGDYLLLHFDGEDKLYLPVDRMRVVQHYKGPEGFAPVLDSLRGARWKNTKERARKAIEKVAKDLVEMYAYRKVAKGYAYAPLGEEYLEFETGFGFEETPDQARAIADVFRDMENPEPMDRLVCGDVGFGKTEVAMRAAFRAVLEGKQVALLCPTTVLAEQHYLNFKTRMQGWPVTVGMLSRFVPKAEQKKVIAAAARGRVDIMIGTHRLLSKDVEFSDLGLLILDEEQRFGVKHKERLKSLRKNIDVLTLTATPIPRTLQLSLSGIRGLSLIETPPPERKAVETALIERDKPVLAGVVKREMERGGQVFWVHNRVRTLDGVAEYVRELVPEARVGTAHGQMSEKRLEEAMHAFWHGEMDVLVCTAIIESGLDFPNANTLVVDQAQLFGLGQLYQLRGRVGRSERQAYAYFVVHSLDSLADQARKRLRVVLDMDYLGAGFKVAMEDLRLRGAGNILGEAQSGQIARVGLDLYLEMLEEEVKRLKGQPVKQMREPEVSFVFPAHIPESYVPDPSERLRYYKEFSSAGDEERGSELALEMRDRFGPLPDALENFLAIMKLKRVLAELGVERGELYPNRAVLAWPEKGSAMTPERILGWLRDRGGWARLLPPGKLEARMDDADSAARFLEKLGRELASLAPKSDEAREERPHQAEIST